MSTAVVGSAAGPSVGIGQIAASDVGPVVISALGLGSCIGVVMTDVRAGIAGMAHVMLPQSSPTSSGARGTCADPATPGVLVVGGGRGA